MSQYNKYIIDNESDMIEYKKLVYQSYIEDKQNRMTQNFEIIDDNSRYLIQISTNVPVIIPLKINISLLLVIISDS